MKGADQRRVFAIIDAVDRDQALRADRDGKFYVRQSDSNLEKPILTHEAIIFVRRYDGDHRTCSLEIRRAVVEKMLERAMLGHDCPCEWCSRGRV